MEIFLVPLVGFKLVSLPVLDLSRDGLRQSDGVDTTLSSLLGFVVDLGVLTYREFAREIDLP